MTWSEAGEEEVLLSGDARYMHEKQKVAFDAH